ncbi:MAG: hypothetical protein BWX62_01228 [Bacteroidetes bacterium ADurb.Bin037]|nr:MAG: hypothetical protein BWX62_01228 [Bacteroidetes bacterium ADurb.Bin037]
MKLTHYQTHNKEVLLFIPNDSLSSVNMARVYVRKQGLGYLSESAKPFLHNTAVVNHNI